MTKVLIINRKLGNWYCIIIKLSLWLWGSHPIWVLVHVPDNGLGKQQRRPKSLGPCIYVGKLEQAWAPGFDSLAIEAISGMN